MTKRKEFATLLTALLCLTACTEDIDFSARYVFTTKTAYEYLKGHEQYSEYVRLLSKASVSNVSKTTLRQLLSARGHYTVFAPTNDAIQTYLDSLCNRGIIRKPSWESFPSKHVLDSIEKVIVCNSIIDGGDNYVYFTSDFPDHQDAEILTPNMYERRLVVHYLTDSPDNPDGILVNDAPIDDKNRDITVSNGVVHAMNRVIAPSNNTLGVLLQNIVSEQRRGFYVSSLLAKTVGLIDTLCAYKDVEYDLKYQRGLIPPLITSPGYGNTPEHRYFGYTYFAETDSLWSALLGKDPLTITAADVVSYLTGLDIYPDARNDDNYKDEDNLLNRFVTYHFLPERLATDQLVFHRNEAGYNKRLGRLSVVMSEFYTTMGKPRLLKLLESKESNGVCLNRFPILDNGRKGKYHELGCDDAKQGIRVGTPNLEGENNVRNGIIYPIDKLLIYDDPTRSSLQRYRIRWDVSAMFPEMVNNNIRQNDHPDYLRMAFAPDAIHKYFNDADFGEQTTFQYFSPNFGYFNYLNDELQLHGMVDATFRMPPVPKRGTYEFRIAVAAGAEPGRGIFQFYWGTDREKLWPVGIPVDFRMVGSDVKWEEDTDDDDYNASVDKQMRLLSFMKAPALYYDGSVSARNMSSCLRRIILRQTLDPDEIYYLRLKNVTGDMNRALYLDYFEYCAKEVFDNPETPEDIW